MTDEKKKELERKIREGLKYLTQKDRMARAALSSILPEIETLEKALDLACSELEDEGRKDCVGFCPPSPCKYPHTFLEKGMCADCWREYFISQARVK